MELVSVIMPAYNAAPYIGVAIESIINQTYSNWELLIADDGSTDNTREIIEKYDDSRIKLYHNNCNQGNLKTVNKLFAMAAGDYIAIQDADDWCDTTKLDVQLQAFKNHRQIGVCGTQSVKLDNNGKVLKRSNFPLTHEGITKFIPEDYTFTSASVMIRRSVYLDIGGFNDYFDRRGGADWYWISLILERFKMLNVPQHLYFYRYNPASITNTKPSNALNYTVGRVIAFLYHQRKRYGKDGVSGNDNSLKKQLKEFENKLDRLYIMDPLLLDREYSVRLCTQGHYYKGGISLVSNFLRGPLLFFKWLLSKLK
ncbi:glycosyltransferase [Fulvivirga kasyanovii]|uniref:Glycosyltransferase family 2 protein n=1 Tax=Fulvivirga kasyanovii TaxID=396812 RepID=A0ABW9RMT4_9BACT|nr:glycosyltransferase family A protein [Fulvivirga kasyanovii]MTI25306.1 glycosyltransferase family 2 protein [Fulvivirga kasyanovii]